MPNKLRRYFLFLIVFCSSIVTAQNKNILILSDNWQFSEQGANLWHPAVVPGTVHTDLWKNKLINDPFYGCQEQELQWIETKNWEYKTTFRVEENILKKTHNELVFEGLDTYAKVYLNDSLVITANNMFCQWKADVKKILKKGENELKVVFESAVNMGKEAAVKLPYILPGDEKVFVRKAQYQFGWDWGPRYVTSGIWKPVYLQSWSDAQILNTQVLQKSVSKEKAELKFATNIFSDEDRGAEINIEDDISGAVYYSKKIELKKGASTIASEFSIDNPELWWTNGLGKPYLYHFKIKLSEGKNMLDQTKVRTGIRTIEVVNKKDDAGASFYFKLNGVDLFIKGANYIPQHSFVTEVKTDDFKDLILQAKESNFNMLRVWGGGIYENDIFYDLCDENGLLVWQDMMFACAMYPGDSVFLENVKSEVKQNTVRLRNHPSLALWCGNNEIDEGWNNWGWQKQYKYSAADSLEIYNNYKKLFEKVIPEIINQSDSGRFYWPSSPQYGWGRAQSLTHGDSHYWGVWWGMEPFETYTKKVGRFASEYGFQAFPEKSTIQKMAKPEEWNLDSETLKCHEKHPAGFQTIKTYMQREYKVPDKLDDYIYVSQLLQAYGIKTAIEAHRNAKPTCMGTLYWQFNDCWPVVSWSGMDYYHNKKALQYFVKKAYNDILVTLTDNEKNITVRVNSDRNNDVRSRLELQLIDFKGKVRWEEKRAVTIKPGMNKVIEEVDKRLILADVSQHKSMVFVAKVLVDDQLVSQNLLYFKKPKDLALEDPGISYEMIKLSGGIEIKLSTKQLAKNVFISFENCDSRDIQLSDNFFDMLPGTTVSIFANTSESIEDLKNMIQIKTLFDVGYK
ncbi:MAG TPA: glycoside hydrolase family 2 protein [Bacteroidales bacterium]|nr:glycoside hydrolase family 2 protein [Bacteroidales bacterium]